MAQHDYVLANAAGSVFRADANDVLSAIVSLNSGGTAPSVTFPHMLWHDTTNAKLKRRDAANAAWIELLEFDEGLGTVTFLGSFDITALTSLTAVDAADSFAVYDTSAVALKQATLSNILKAINTLTAETAPAIGDLLALYDTSSATTDKITLESMFGVVNGFTEVTALDDAADYLPVWDNSASAIRKVKPSNLASSGGITTIASGSLTGATVSITDIPATYSHLIMKIASASNNSGGSESLLVRVSTNNGTSYDSTDANYPQWYRDDGGADGWQQSASLVPNRAASAAQTVTATVNIFGYHAGPEMTFRAMARGWSSDQEHIEGTYIGSTAAIDAIRLSWSGGASFDGGTYALYGVK